MKWCVDTRVPGASTLVEDQICGYLLRHASERQVVDLARPMISQGLGALPRGLLWVSLDWDDRHGRLRGRGMPGSELPGEPVGDGVTRAPEETEPPEAGDPGTADDGPILDVSLNVSRLAQRDLDPGPADPDLVPADRPGHLLGLVAGEISAGRTLEEAAARAGATVAEREVRRTEGDRGRSGPLSAAQVAQLLVDAEEQLGAEFDLVSVSADRVVVRNRRCPFGQTAPAMCRFTSALAGGLAARATGEAEVDVTESLAAGDHECRVVLDLGPPRHTSVSHRYTWPPHDAAGSAETVGNELDDGSSRAFQVTLSLLLPRDRLSVPVTRHLIHAGMQAVGVVPDDAADVELAVTEACTNVIDHAGPGDAYDVSVTIGSAACHIRVVDVGRGFDHGALSTSAMASGDAEHGRGVALMHALVDQVHFESEPERGTVVHLVKRLRFDDSDTARRLMMEGGTPTDPTLG